MIAILNHPFLAGWKTNSGLKALALILGGTLASLSVAAVISDCIGAAQAAFAVYSVGIRGLSLEGDAEYAIQESRRTAVLALGATELEERKKLVDRSREADLRAERLINDLLLLPIPPEVQSPAQEFLWMWSEYLEIRDLEVALMFGGQVHEAYQTDIERGDPKFQGSYSSLHALKASLDQYAQQRESKIRNSVYRASAELVILLITILGGLFFWGRNLDHRRA